MPAELFLLTVVSVCLSPLLGVLVLADPRRNTIILLVSAVSVRLLINVANQWLGLFEPKLAGAFSVHLFESINSGVGTDLGSSFLVQAILSWPFLLVNNSLQSVILANNVLSLLLSLIGMRLLKPCLSRRSWFLLLSTVLLFPAVMNFNMFGLRDPIIFGFVLIFAASVVRLQSSFSPVAIAWLFLSVLPLLSLRPEMSVIVVVPLGLVLIRGAGRLRVGRQSGTGKFALRTVVVAAFLAVALPAVLALGVRALGNIGISKSEASLNALQASVESRFVRQAGEAGGGSSIYNVQSFQSLPLPQRAAVSFAGMLVIPFPWQVTNAAQLLAFLESLVVLGILGWMLTGNRRRLGFSSNSRDMLITYLIGSAVIGFFMINFGNAYRMRLSVLPFLFVAVALVHDRYIQQLKARSAKRIISHQWMSDSPVNR